MEEYAAIIWFFIMLKTFNYAYMTRQSDAFTELRRMIAKRYAEQWLGDRLVHISSGLAVLAIIWGSPKLAVRMIVLIALVDLVWIGALQGLSALPALALAAGCNCTCK